MPVRDNNIPLQDFSQNNTCTSSYPPPPPPLPQQSPPPTPPSSTPSSSSELNDLETTTTTTTTTVEVKDANNFHVHRKFVLVMVFTALLVDNILLTAIVPIVPDLLLSQLHNNDEMSTNHHHHNNHSLGDNRTEHFHSATDTHSVSLKTGFLFGSKALVQLLVAPFIGSLVEKHGPKVPLVGGSFILLISTLLFAFINEYWLLFAARTLQGFGSSCCSVAGLSMLATYYTDDDERGGAFGIALGGLAVGVLIGPVFGGMLYHAAGRALPFLVLSGMIVINGAMQIFLLKSKSPERKEKKEFSMLKLLADPRIVLTAVTITVGNFGIAMLEPNLPLWMRTSLNSNNLEQGIVFLPSSFFYLVSTNVFGWFGNRFGRRLGASMGLAMISVAFVILPFSRSLWHLMIPMSIIGVGVGMVDGTMMPTMGLLVDQKHESAYGAVYAIADSAFCVGFALGPFTSGSIYNFLGFQWMMTIVAVITLLVTPLLIFLGNLKTPEVPVGSSSP